ncbi:MAG: transposase, partial [Candidatus Aenigmarchaeota archaeon]|nr:transposase [Candidatus Aenigmarchaeota archaeon]
MSNKIYNSIYLSFALIKKYLPERAKYTIDAFIKLVILAQDKNKYIENIDGNGLSSADTFHIRIKKNGTIQNIHESFRVKISKFLKNTKQKIVLLFDETYEPYYGHDKSNRYIHGYRPVRGSKGCYKFLCCQALLPDGTKIFVDAILLPIFYDTANEVGKIITFIKSTNTKILFCLFDRGYYSSALIKELKKQKVRYLMLVPKTSGIKKILEENSETIFVKKEYMVNGKVSTDIIVVRDERFDWTFATNLRFRNLINAIRTYKIRWNIETGFRVTDEARIKSKSKNIVIRY